MAPLQTNFSYQTTLSSKELRANPQHIRPAAYETIAVSNFPMNSSFNLFQEEARAYLNYLRVPRFELMETFQDWSNEAAKVPDDVAIAAEYFGISSHEKTLIVTPKKTSAAQNQFWGFNTTQTSVPVTNLLNPEISFLKRSKLNYYELLDLLMVRFVNAPDSPNRSEIARPADTCNTDEQTINNLSVTKFDLMHRFIRLWRKTGWKMWELDLLIRNQKIGTRTINGEILLDDNTLVNLKRFKQLQEKLKLPFETMLAFYGDINREVRIKADKSDVKIDPLYKNLFQNIALTNPVDDFFVGVKDDDTLKDLDSSIIFGINVIEA